MRLTLHASCLLLLFSLPGCKESGLTAAQACRDGCRVTCNRMEYCALLQPDVDAEQCYDECIPDCGLSRWTCPDEKDAAPLCHDAIATLDCTDLEDYRLGFDVPEACVSPCTD